MTEYPCRERGGPVEEEWRLSQALPENPLCEACWRVSRWGPQEAVPVIGTLSRGPVLLTFTLPNGETQRQTASTLWTANGRRVAYLTPSWRHHLDLGERVSEDTYEVADDRWPPGTLLAVTPDDGPVWWDEREQPDEDLLNLLRV